MGMKQKKIFFWKKKFKMADSKKAHFLKSPILKIFSRKFLRFVLGLVGLNDVKGIDVAQCIWPWGCPTKAQKQPKNAFSVLFGFCWTASWPYTLSYINALRIIQSYTRTHLRNFREKNLRIGDFEKWAFFESAILNFFFRKIFFFASFPWKSAQIYMVEWMGQNFDVFPGFQKIPCYA